MIEVFRSVQLDLMLILSGISDAVAFFLALSKSLDKERKLYLILANLFSVLLLISDRAAYRGDPSQWGGYVVRVSNFMTFAMLLMILWAFNNYFQDICKDEPGIGKKSKRLIACNYNILTGLFLLAASQITGLYYTIDENWDSDDFGSNKITVNKTEQFTTWDDWKAINKKSFVCSITNIRIKDS